MTEPVVIEEKDKEVKYNFNDNVKQVRNVLAKRNYILGSIIGAGTFSTVYMADGKENKKYAVKIADDKTSFGNISTDVAINKAIGSHPNIIPLVEYLSDYNTVIYPYYDLSLSRYIINMSRKKGLATMLIKSYLYQILTGLTLIHSKGYIHQDLTSQNILIDQKGGLVIADFGNSVLENKATDHFMTSLYYKDPEVILCGKISRAMDLWSVGVVLCHMVSDKLPFEGRSDIEQAALIYNKLGLDYETEVKDDHSQQIATINMKKLQELVPKLDEKGLDLLSKLFIIEPHRRITASEALKHEWFSDYLKMIGK